MIRTLRQPAAGFTLIELMIAVVVMAILMGIAVASYESQIRKANRSEAMDALSRAAMAQERYLFAYGRYAKTLDGAVNSDGLDLRTTTSEGASDNAYYDLEMDVDDDRLTYTLRAVPRGGRQVRDNCGTLVLTHSGDRHAATAGCW